MTDDTFLFVTFTLEFSLVWTFYFIEVGSHEVVEIIVVPDAEEQTYPAHDNALDASNIR